MKKIISLFQRDYEGSHKVFNSIVPGAEWVINGEGMATRKFDGTASMVKDGVLYKRYDCKNGKNPPYGFIPAQDPDPITGHWPGWVKVENAPDDRWFKEAELPKEDATYELCGPRVNKNPEGYDKHILVRHGSEVLPNCPRTFEEIKEYLGVRTIEGIVWHHPDGRMVKIKKRDFQY
jgi:hypothetical protein